MGRVRRRRALLLAATTLVGSLALSEGAIWDGLFGGNNNNNNYNQQAPPPPSPPVVTEQNPTGTTTIPATGAPTPPLTVEPPLHPPKTAEDDLTPPPGLDMKGVDPHSLITRAAVGHPIPAGQCGIYTRESETEGDTTQIAICIESIIEYGTDLKQMNGFLVNNGNVPLCDLLIQPAMPSGSILRSFWPGWALENLQDIYIDPGQVTSMGLTLRPERADPNELPRVDVWAFKDCSQSVYDAATGGVTFELVPIEEIMPLAQVVEVFSEGGNKASAGIGAAGGAGAGAAVATGALLQEGECAIYSKPGLLAADIEAQSTLCIESVIRWGNQIVQVNGLMVNTGKVPLCAVQLAFEKESSYFSVWPRWAMMGRWRDDFQPGEAIAVGFSAPGRSDGTFPAMALDNFDVCGRVDSDGVFAASAVEVVIVNMDDLLGNPDPKDVSKAAEHNAQVSDTSAGTKTDMSASIPAQTAIPAGTCGVYRKGQAELSLCSESLVHWGKDVQQLNGFMMNTGTVTICDIKLKPALPSGETYSLWPDWAHDGAYETFFNPSQLTAVGMTGPITDTTPYMEIVSFRDCKAPAAAALDPITSFSTVQIETIQMPNASEELVSIPAAVAIPINIGAKKKLRRAQAAAAGMPMPVAPLLPPAPAEKEEDEVEMGENVIPQGHCALYAIGTGVLALCIESVIHWGVDLTQVNAYLENVSEEPLCQISVALSGSPRGYESIWPKWVQEGTYPGMFKPGQVSPIGLVAPYEATMPNPYIVVESFSLCAKVINATPKQVEIVHIGDLKHIDVGGLPMGRPDYVPGAAAAATDAIPQRMDAPDKAGQGATAIPPPPPVQQKQQQPAQEQTQAALEPPKGVAVYPGRCSMASARLFNMHVKFCVDQTQMWSDDVMQMSGQIENIGDSAICDLRLGHNFEKAAVATVWPQWSLAGAAYSKPFLPRDKINVGLTANPKGLKEGVDPSLSVVSFRPCASNKMVALEQVWEGPMAEKVVDLLHPYGVVTTEEEETPATEEGRRRLAMKNGAKPTTMDTINWDLCGYYTGKDGKSELALCWKDAKSWKDKDAGRVVQTNLILVNTGKFGVCNVTVEIENIDQELGDHYPTNWLDEDGEDTFPSYPGYYAPEQIVNMGAAVPVASGFPEVGISADFTACDPPPPKATPPRKADCVVKTNAAGVELNFCLYSKPKVWTEYDGPRVVMVEGYIENVGKETACNIEVYIENFENNQAKWGEWMPKFPYKLSPGATLKFGANIPFKKGIPKSNIKAFDRCDPLEERRRM